MSFSSFTLSPRTIAVTLGAASLLTLLVPRAALAQVGFTQADTQLLANGTSLSPAQGTARAGFTGTPASGIVPIFFYRLPTLAAGTTITSAVLSLNLTAITNQFGVTYNADLYGLSFRAMETFSLADFYVGPSDVSTNATLLQNNFVLRSAVPNTVPSPIGFSTSSVGSAATAAYLNAQYAAGATGGNFVVFRLSPDVTTASAGGYDFATQDNALASLRPTLSITTAGIGVLPEPGAGALLATVLLPIGAVALWRRRR